MVEQFLVTDITRMKDNRVCVAGMLPSGEYLRPFPGRTTPTESWLLRLRNRPVRPFALLEIEPWSPRPDLVAPHLEDWDIAPTFTYRRDLTGAERRAHLTRDARPAHLTRDARPALADLFGAPVLHDDTGASCWVANGTGQRSLATLAVSEVLGVGSRDRQPSSGLRLRFRDHAGAFYDLPVTDLSCRMYVDWLIAQEGVPPLRALARIGEDLRAASTVFLRVGIGRGFDRYPGRCFPQVNGISSFPDYLHGRCYADFIPVRKQVVVPF